jgi:hypothetical protein
VWTRIVELSARFSGGFFNTIMDVRGTLKEEGFLDFFDDY